MAGEIFISYRRADEAHARYLYDQLKAQGVDAWYDVHVGAGEDWRQTTARALENARIFVLLFSRAAADSDDIAKELAAATFSKKLIVPVRIENVEPRGAFLYELASRNWVNAYEATQTRLDELAKSLADLVKSGKTDPSMLPFERKAAAAKTGKLPSRIGLIAAGAALAIAVAAGIGAFLMQPKAAGITQRFAFFGFSADASLADAVSTATDTMFTTMASERMDFLPRSETLGGSAEGRVARAAGLGAQYALSGELRKEGEDVVASMQLVDVPTKTTLWEESVKAPAGSLRLLADRAAYLAVPISRCVPQFRATLADPEKMDVVRLIPRACRDVTVWGPANLQVWRELAAKTPESSVIQSAFVIILNTARGGAELTAAPALLAEAEDAMRKVDAAAPTAPETYRARGVIAYWKGEPKADIEKIIVEGAERWPSDAWLAYNYATFLRGVGRLRESVAPSQFAVNSDKLSPLKLTMHARTMLATGELPDEGKKQLLRVLEISQYPIAWYVLFGSIAFVDQDVAEAALALAPPTLPADMIRCTRETFEIVKAYDAGKPFRPDPNSSCATNSQGVRQDTIFTLLTYVGDIDAAYARPANPLPVGETVFMFIPQTRAARMDPRFEKLADAYGLMDYWRTTGKLPDFCETEQAPVCATLRAARPN